MTSKDGYPGPIWFIMYTVHVKDVLPPSYESWLEEIINFVSLSNHMLNFGLSTEDFMYYETEDENGKFKLSKTGGTAIAAPFPPPFAVFHRFPP